MQKDAMVGKLSSMRILSNLCMTNNQESEKNSEIGDKCKESGITILDLIGNHKEPDCRQCHFLRRREEQVS